MSATQSLKVVEAELNGAPGVALRGEIDLEAVPSLEPALDATIRETAGAFVLGLYDLDFLDSSGLRLILRARALLARGDREHAIVCPPVPSAGCSSWPASRICCFSTPRRRSSRGAGGDRLTHPSRAG